jgi:hypothetical protein
MARARSLRWQLIGSARRASPPFLWCCGRCISCVCVRSCRDSTHGWKSASVSAPESHDTSSGVGLQPSDFASTAGTQNTGSYTRYESLLPDSHRGGLFVSASYRFESGQELFAELLATRYKLDGEQDQLSLGARRLNVDNSSATCLTT